MDTDDKQLGRVLTRREAVAILGAAGASLLTGCSSGQTAEANATPPAASASASIPGCVVRPAQTEGPYFVDEKLNRSDIRSDPSDGTIKPGTPLGTRCEVDGIVGFVLHVYRPLLSQYEAIIPGSITWRG